MFYTFDRWLVLCSFCMVNASLMRRGVKGCSWCLFLVLHFYSYVRCFDARSDVGGYNQGKPGTGLAGWLFITTGHTAAEIALLCLFALGLGTVIKVQWVTAVVGIIGGLVLFIMGLDMLMGALRDRVSLDLNGRDKTAGQITPKSIGRAVGAGVIVSAANPYWIIWWLTIGVMYVAEALKYGWLGLGFFYTGHILADYVWYVLIAVIVATGKVSNSCYL